jgi:hypothetical protein
MCVTKACFENIAAMRTIDERISIKEVKIRPLGTGM